MGKPIAGPEYWRAEDLIQDGVWGERRLKVSAAHKPNTIKSPDGKWIDKEILEFEGETKRMIVGPLNWRLIKYAVGIANKEEVIGHTLTLHATVLEKCFGQSNVAALRVRIPEGNFRPFLSVSNIGLDITGQRFAPVEPVWKQSPEQYVNSTQNAVHLQKMLESWLPKRPVAANLEAWQDIVRYADAKIVISAWEPSVELESLDELLDSIKAEFPHATVEG